MIWNWFWPSVIITIVAIVALVVVYYLKQKVKRGHSKVDDDILMIADTLALIVLIIGAIITITSAVWLISSNYIIVECENKLEAHKQCVTICETQYERIAPEVRTILQSYQPHEANIFEEIANTRDGDALGLLATAYPQLKADEVAKTLALQISELLRSIYEYKLKIAEVEARIAFHKHFVR